jgi:hypothetical protein
MNKRSYNKRQLNIKKFSGAAGYSQELSLIAIFPGIGARFARLKTADLNHPLFEDPRPVDSLPSFPSSGHINLLNDQSVNFCLRN